MYNEWQPIETAPKDGQKLIVGYRNSLGKWRTVMASYATQEAIEEATRVHVELCARRAGLTLNDTQLALLCEVAPHAFAMAARIRRNFDRGLEPANVFRFPESVH